MDRQKKLDNKIVISAMKTKIKDDKMHVKQLKAQIKTLEKKLAKSSDAEKPVIEGLIKQAQTGLDEISRQTTGLLTQLISNAPSAKAATRIVKKMGYQTVEGFLNANNDLGMPDYTKDYIKGCSDTVTYGDDPSVLLRSPAVAPTFIPDIADLSINSSKK